VDAPRLSIHRRMCRWYSPHHPVHALGG
jgi:hypothetical protein